MSLQLFELGPVVLSRRRLLRMRTMNRRNAPTTTVVTALALLVSMCVSLTFSQRTSANADQSSNNEGNEFPVLSKYATDQRKLAAAGKIQGTREHDADVARVIPSLAAAKNPVMVSESDLDREVIARGVAIKIAFGDVPETLRAKRVFRLSIDALAKGASSSDEFSTRVQAVFAEAA